MLHETRKTKEGVLFIFRNSSKFGRPAYSVESQVLFKRDGFYVGDHSTPVPFTVFLDAQKSFADGTRKPTNSEILIDCNGMGLIFSMQTTQEGVSFGGKENLLPWETVTEAIGQVAPHLLKEN